VRLTVEEALTLLANATPPPWKLSPDGQQITQTSHLTRDVWTIPRTPEDMQLIAHVHDLGELLRSVRSPGPQGEVISLFTCITPFTAGWTFSARSGTAQTEGPRSSPLFLQHITLASADRNAGNPERLFSCIG